jgi:glycosyltransferase involved in cell wall biosynthesis
VTRILIDEDTLDGVRLTVVIACLNGERTLGRQLDALLRQTVDVWWEIVVSDNGSSDGSREIVETYAARNDSVRLVDSSAQRGLAHARNVGASAARGRDLAFCDQDDEVAPGWASAMLAALDQHDFVAGALEHDRLNEPWTIAVRGRPQAEGLLEYPELEYLPFAFGCTLGVRRALHEAIGGFDPSFTNGCEDADYCWRMQRLGHELAFVPEAVTHYRFRADLAGIYRQARDYGRSEARLYAKHRALGLPRLRHPWLRALRAWASTLRSSLTPVTRSRRAAALWRLGQRVGRLTGSLHHRVLLP